MLDPIGHYDGLLAWLHGLVDTGYVAEVALDRLIVVDDVDAAMEVCAPAVMAITRVCDNEKGRAHRMTSRGRPRVRIAASSERGPERARIEA